MNCHGNADNTVVLHLTRQCLIVSLQYQNQKVIGVADVGVRIEWAFYRPLSVRPQCYRSQQVERTPCSSVELLRNIAAAASNERLLKLTEASQRTMIGARAGRVHLLHRIGPCPRFIRSLFNYSWSVSRVCVMANTFQVQLRRMETSQPWGFRLRGGIDQGMPLFVEHVRIYTLTVIYIPMIWLRSQNLTSVEILMGVVTHFLILPQSCVMSLIGTDEAIGTSLSRKSSTSGSLRT